MSLCPLSSLAQAIDAPQLASFSESEAWSRQDDIGELIAATLRTQTTSEWSERMEAARIWHARVQSYSDILADPQVKHMQALVTARGGGDSGTAVTLVNHPVLYDGESAEVRLPPQPLGAQSRDVLGEIGFAPAEIAALIRSGVVHADDG